MGAAAPRLDGARFACLRSATPPMRNSAASARRSTRGWRSSAARASPTRRLRSRFRARPPRHWIKGALEALAPPPRRTAGNVVAVDFAARGRRSRAASRVARARSSSTSISIRRAPTRRRSISRSAFDGARAGLRARRLARNLSRRTIRRWSRPCCAAAGLEGDDAPAQRAHDRARHHDTVGCRRWRNTRRCTGHAGAARLHRQRQARAWIEGRQLIDLLEAFPATLARRQLMHADAAAAAARLFDRVLAHANSPTRRICWSRPCATRRHGRARAGVASTHVADRLKAGGTRPRAR